MNRILAAITATMVLAGCAGSPTISQRSLTYPYVTPPERQAEIVSGMDKIKTGMTPAKVEAILGKTDLVHDLFNRGMKDSSPIGYTWWYILQRKTDTGSFAEREEKLVRVSFDLRDTVTKVDFWGIDKPDNN